MDVQTEAMAETPVTLTPYRYPIWVIIVALIVVGMTVYSLTLLPRYMHAAHALRAGDVAYAAGEDAKAQKLYQVSVLSCNQSQYAKFNYARTVFRRRDTGHYKLAFRMLSQVQIDEGRWTELKAVMPTEFQAAFKEVRR